MIAGFLRDLRLALRQLRRQPLFAAAAILTLAAGMGVNVVAFTVVNGVLIRRPPIATLETAGRVETTPGRDEGGSVSLPEWRRFAEATRGRVDLAAEGRLSLVLRLDGSTRTTWGLAVSPDYFQTVGAGALVGDVVVGRTAGQMPAVVIGERFWRTVLAGRPLSGLTLELNRAAVAVSGVLPESFRGPGGLYAPDVWLALDDLDVFHVGAALREARDERWLLAFGRLHSGATFAEVHGHVERVATEMARDWPDTHRDRRARFVPLREGTGERHAVEALAALAMSIIGLVLLLACFNVANLLVARGVDRERDLAIRAAIGAGGARLASVVLADGLVFATLAGIATAVLASWTQALVGRFAIPIDEPQFVDLRLDLTVIAFTALLVIVAAVVPGLWPARMAVRVDVTQALAGQGSATVGGRPSPLRRVLVGAQVAGSTAFLALTALLAQSYLVVSQADVGFAQAQVLVTEVHPAAQGYDEARADRYVRSLAERTAALPGVSAVALADRAPFSIGFDTLTTIALPAQPCDGQCQAVATVVVEPTYFETLGIAFAEGGTFDEVSATDVVVNRPLAKVLFADGEALGRTILLGEARTPARIVGITARTLTRSLTREAPTLYVPLTTEAFAGRLSLVVRTSVPPATLVRAVAREAEAISGEVPAAVRTMDQRMAVQRWPFQTVSWLFGICGVLALALGTGGLAAVVVHTVSRRRREFALRQSLGATPRALAADVLAGAGRLLIPGCLVGLVLAAIAARFLKAILVGVGGLSPGVCAAVVAVEAIVVLVACLGPSLAAARVDPVVALRTS